MKIIVMSPRYSLMFLMLFFASVLRAFTKQLGQAAIFKKTEKKDL